MKRIAPTYAFSLGVFGAAALIAPKHAQAQEANGFGERGQLILSADRLLPVFSYASESMTTSANGQETTIRDSGSSVAFLLGRDATVSVNPHAVPRLAVDYAVVHNFTVGGSFVLALGLGGSRTIEAGSTTTTTDSPGGTLVGFAPRAGYVLPLGSSFGIWPRAGFAYYSITTKSENRGNNPTTTTFNDSLWSLDLDPQFVWVPMKHFFAHGGPLLNIPFAGSRTQEDEQGNTTRTTKHDLSVFHFGLSLGLGGWFDL